MYQIANQYNYPSFATGNWSAANYSFSHSLANAYEATGYSSGINSHFANAMPQASIRTAYAPDPAYAALYPENGAYAQAATNSFEDGTGGFGGMNLSSGANQPPVLGANQPPVLGANQPPAWGYYEPPGDLYSWNDDGPKTPDKPDRPDRPDKPDKPDKPDEPDKPVEPSKPRREVTGSIIGDPIYKGADGEDYRIYGEANKIYNLFSDKGIQVNGKYTSFDGDGWKGNAVTEMGFVTSEGNTTIKIDPKTREFEISANGKQYDGKKDFTEGNVTWDAKNHKLTVAAKGPDGEKWDFTTSYQATGEGDLRTRWLNLDVKGTNIVKDEYMTTGLWGHSFDGVKSDTDARDNTGGGGVLRKSDGSVLSKSADHKDEEYKNALKGYEMGSLTDTTGGWSAY